MRLQKKGEVFLKIYISSKKHNKPPKHTKQKKVKTETKTIKEMIELKRKESPAFSKLWDTRDIAPERVHELAEAELNGRCIIPPVPIGTQLWEAKNGYTYSFQFDLTDGESFFQLRRDLSVFSKPFSDFGITLFNDEQRAKDKALEQQKEQETNEEKQ